MAKAYLVLASGKVFEGEKLGADGETRGELVFTTNMNGYIETLTDPSYYGQIVLQTFPIIGNYGIIPEDFEGKCALRGYVVGEACNLPSNFRSKKTLDEFLKENGVVGIKGVDTREITRLIRTGGVTNAVITTDIEGASARAASYRISGAVLSVGGKRARFSISGNKKEIALLDYGAKRNIVRELLARGCNVDVLPANTLASEILAKNYDGIVLSNGPGDPEENVFEIEQVKKLYGKLPIFGICLGHQILALSCGARTEKLKFGHRGANQPVKDLTSGRTYITSQNHGYAVCADSIKCGKISYINANDQTVEGITYPERAFSVQFHPEASAGPHDTEFLFERFLKLTEAK